MRMAEAHLFLTLAPGMLFLAPAAAQDALGQMEQVSAAEAGAVGQISSGSREVSAPSSGEPRTSAASPQLSSQGESRGTAPQLTRERGTRMQTQLYTGGRTAQPSEPLSRPSEGRTATVAPVAGEDRCDGIAADQPELIRACAAVIERRSAEFKASEAPTLSPEQRLLVEQRLREKPTNVKDASLRLARSAEDADSIEAQAVASLVLRGDPIPPKDEKPVDATQGLSEAAAAIVNAIVGGAGGGSGSPPPE